jgi:hypothetical protein
LLNPMLVTHFPFPQEKSYYRANRRVGSSGGFVPRTSEINASNEMIAERQHSLAECENQIDRGSQNAITVGLHGDASAWSVRLARSGCTRVPALIDELRFLQSLISVGSDNKVRIHGEETNEEHNDKANNQAEQEG